jgi:hypothetical protein
MTIEQILPYVMGIGVPIISGLCGRAVTILARLAHDVAALNSKMAVIMTEMAYSTTRSDRIEEKLETFDQRIRHIEVSRAH